MEMIGFLLPALIDVINRKISDHDLKFWVSVAVCSVVGVGINYLTTGFVFASALEAFNSVSASIMVVFGTAQLAYQGLWKESGIRNTLNLKGGK